MELRDKSPSLIADFDFEEALSEASDDELLALTEALSSAAVDRMSQRDMRVFYLPYLSRLVRLLCERTPQINRMALGRELLLDRQLEQALRSTDEATMRRATTDLLTLARTVYAFLASRPYAASVPKWGYNNLHDIESCLYGDDRYMREVLGDRLPEGILERIGQVFGLPETATPRQVEQAVGEAYRQGRYRMITDCAYELMVLAAWSYSSFRELPVALSLQQQGRMDEFLPLFYRAGRLRYGEAFDSLYPALAFNMNFQAVIEALNEFAAFRENLRARGVPCAEYLVWDCPPEYCDGPEYDAYLSAYVRLQREVILIFCTLSGAESFFDLRQILDFFGCNDLPSFYTQALRGAISVYAAQGNPWALDTIERLLPMIEQSGSFDPLTFVRLAELYHSIGAMDKVESILGAYLIPYVKEECTYSDSLFVYDLECAAGMASLASGIHKAEYDTIAAQAIEQVLSRMERVESESPEFGYYLCGLISDYYCNKGDYTACIALLEKALAHCRDEEYRPWLMIGLHDSYYQLKDYERTADYGWQIVSSSAESVSHPSELFATLVHCYASTGDIRRMDSCAVRYIDALREELSAEIFNLDAEDRQARWEKVQADLEPVYRACGELGIGVGENPAGEPILARTLYDWLLLSKGLLLQSDRRMDEQLRNSPDSLVRLRYAQMAELSAKLDAAGLRGADSLSADPFFREQLYQARQDVLAAVRQINSDGAADPFGQIRWQDVRERLTQGEAAVEFGCIHYSDSLSEGNGVEEGYYALILRPGDAAPQVVSLCSERELDKTCSNLSARRLYTNPIATKKLYELLWKPLEPYLDEGQTVYYSLEGRLHLFNLDVLRDAQGQMADGRYRLCRLSSTRELCLDRERSPWRKAVLYGGLDYRMDKEQWRQAESSYRKMGLRRSRGTELAGKVPRDSLPETLAEVEHIAALLTDRSIETDVVSGARGIESSVKALSGCEINLLHFATHGFYIDSLTDYQKGEEKLSPMMRSGLMLSGVENSLSVGSSEDGILLAREIADLDLSAVDMVVLSACETAQGEVSSDGVFGLQRGFKQAGVGTIVMTLWTVDSEMAQRMMTDFYRGLVQGLDRHQAFRQARATARSAYPQRDWAAFILLD